MTQSKPPIKIPQQALELYDNYAHGAIDRRRFLTALTAIAGGSAAATSLLGAILPNYALANQVSFNDENIKASYATFSSPQGHGQGRGYLVHPTKAAAPAPVVLVVHENRGLNPYIEDVARRLAKSGFIAFAPDALFPVGGYPGNDDDGRSLQAGLDREKVVQDLMAAAKFAKNLDQGNGKLGVVGFCFGGAIAQLLAADLPEVIDAAVPFYGSPPDLAKVGQIEAPLLIHLGELDKRVNDQYPPYEAELKRHEVAYQLFVYTGANHGFHNDSTPRYDAEAAKLAWDRTLAFFTQHLESQ